ncbi:MAG: hypothetical protein PVG78_14920 [Desulfobacterales bacterium]|jgi:hypothetical protein
MVNYRLGELKILETANGNLRWESHFGFGALQEGKCFKKGEILFIASAEYERPGFLKGEFLDHLRNLPRWRQTRYLCRGVDINRCQDGKKVSNVEAQLWELEQNSDEAEWTILKDRKEVAGNSTRKKTSDSESFRLRKYKITIKNSGELFWESHNSPAVVACGKCYVMENILFLGPRRKEQVDLNKKQFHVNLKKLPKWTKTKYFSKKLSPQKCWSQVGIEANKKELQKPIDAAMVNSASIKYDTAQMRQKKRTEKSEPFYLPYLGKWIKCCFRSGVFTLIFVLSIFIHLFRLWESFCSLCNRVRKERLRKFNRGE